MKKFYQNSDAFTCVTIRDRKRLSDIFSEYGLFIFHTNRYGDGSAYEETIVCTSFAENLDPAFDSFDFSQERIQKHGYHYSALSIKRICSSIRKAAWHVVS